METKGLIGRSEYGGTVYEWIDQGGEVYRCPASNAIDCTTGYRIGRWECSREHFEQNRKTTYSFVKES